MAEKGPQFSNKIKKAVLTLYLAIYSTVHVSLRGKSLTCPVFNSPVVATVNSFLKDVDSLNTSLLLAIQRLAKLAETRTRESSEEDTTADSGRLVDGFVL